MSRHKKTFAPRANRSEAQITDNIEEQEKYVPISSQDAKISLAKTEVIKITYAPFQNRAFNKVERGSSIIKFSNNGLHVLALNKALNTLGYKAPENETLFLDKTKIALMNFQGDHGIQKSGVFDKKTLLKMNEALEALKNGEGKDQLSVSERAKLLYEAFEHRTLKIFGGTDEAKVFKALEKLSYEDRKELITYYDEKYKPKRKVGLVQDLYEELDDKDLYKAIRLLYANYDEPQQEPQPKSQQEPEQESKGQLLEEVIINAKKPYPWIKSKTKYTIEGEPIEFECVYQYETPVISALGSKSNLPEVVRKVLIQKDNTVYSLLNRPDFVENIKTFRQDGTVISEFSINTEKSGIYTFVFIIENTITNEFSAYTKKHQVKTLEEAASDNLKKNKIQNYSDFRQQIAFIDFNLSKGAVKEQKSNPYFYIKTESSTKNPEEVGTVYSDYIPHLYYSIKGKPIPKDYHYFWFAEINTPKEMADEVSALLGVEYARNAVVHGYQRGTYFGKDGWDMNSSQTTAAFLGSFTGVFTIHCLELDKNNHLAGQQASYQQVILPKEDYKALQNIREYKRNIDKSFNTILPNTALALNAIVINEKTTETLSLNLFLGKSKTNSKNYVLTDLTPGVLHKRTYEGSNIKDLFKEFDRKNTYPDGILAYEIPVNTLGYPSMKGNFTTDGESMWESLSTKAGWASLGLAVAGLAASFTPAAPIAPFLFIAAGATGAVSGTASIIDKVQQGTLTKETLTLDVIMIASSFLGMAGSLSNIVKASSILKISATGMRYIIITDFALNGTAGIMITSDGLESIQAINDNKNLTTAEKIDATVKILAQLTLTAGLLVLSSKNLKGVAIEGEQLPKKKNKTSTQSKKPYNPEQHSEFIDTPHNLTDGILPKLTGFKQQLEIAPLRHHLTEEQLINFKKALESADPKVLNEINNQDKLINFVKSYKDNPKVFTQTVKSYEKFLGEYGWYKFWKKMPDFGKSSKTIDLLKSENKLLPIGDATHHDLATVHVFTVDGGLVNTPARFEPSWWGEYNSQIYEDLKIALDKLRKVEERNMNGKTVLSGRMESLDYFESTLKNGKGKEVPFKGMVSATLDEKVAEGFIELSAKNVKKGEKVAIIRKIETVEGVYIDDLSDWGKNLGPIRHSDATPPSTMIQEEVLMNEGYFLQTTDPKYIKTIDDIDYYEIKYKELVKPLN
ncbi:hypothetical protein A0O34_16495 [Chryseobacterium glaciei]|uniref:Peptidoglycan binding-like domain-containing protein n=1 Tax=Chryseobacterium glaciei TaxID=1685010 RepID=A0A172XYD0_9FLAO|nr:peptidoglycan-binding domain-containing protein [Chryseobacterium glaciei]ANF52013.1 hypothetical protein A0O34_16495 [Chryseobacterium glaciei]